jgi:VCBS repeat-containing protein
MVFSWLRGLMQREHKVNRRRQVAKPRWRSIRLELEVLEGRAVPSAGSTTLVTGSPSDTGQVSDPDTTAPTTTISLAGTPGKNGYYVSPVTVTLAATDPDNAPNTLTTTYSINGGTNQPYTTPFTISTNGTTTITFFSTDPAGNVEASNTQTINIDTVAPVISATANPTRLWPPNGKMVDVQITGTASDNLTQLTTGTYTTVDSYGKVQPSGTFTINPDGTFSFSIPLQARRHGYDKAGRTYTVTLNVQDQAGNVGTFTLTITVPHDLGHHKGP